MHTHMQTHTVPLLLSVCSVLRHVHKATILAYAHTLFRYLMTNLIFCHDVAVEKYFLILLIRFFKHFVFLLLYSISHFTDFFESLVSLQVLFSLSVIFSLLFGYVLLQL